MVTSYTNDELNSELRSANKSTESRHQKFKFALKQQALQHPVKKKHLSCDRFGTSTCKFKMLSQNEYHFDHWGAQL